MPYSLLLVSSGPDIAPQLKRDKHNLAAIAREVEAGRERIDALDADREDPEGTESSDGQLTSTHLGVCARGVAVSEVRELAPITDAIEAYEAIRWPHGKISGGKG